MSSTDALSAVCIFGMAMLTMLVSSTDMNMPTIRTHSGPIQLFPEAGAAGAGAGAGGCGAARGGAGVDGAGRGIVRGTVPVVAGRVEPSSVVRPVVAVLTAPRYADGQ